MWKVVLASVGAILGGIFISAPTVKLMTTTRDIPNGIWISRGYGWVLVKSNYQLKAYEETSVSCLRNQDLLEYIESVKVEGDVLTITTEGITDYVFDKATKSPGFCAQGITPVQPDGDYTRNASLIFDIVVQTFAENYPYFDLRGIDWEALTTPIREALSPESTDEELFAAFTHILSPLADDSAFVASEGFIVQKQFPLLVQFKKEYEEQHASSDFGLYFQSQIIRWIEILEGYMVGRFNGRIMWGHIKDANVGYMQTMSLDPDDDDAFFADFESALKSFKNKDAVILDIRAVEGDGDDDIPLKMVSYFTSKPVPVFAKRAVKADGYTTTVVHSTQPVADATGARFDGQVIVITSGSTVGSSEILALSLAQLPQTTVLGRDTSGCIGASNRLERTLPNQWDFGLANHEYTTPDGKMYEKVGYPVDVRADSELLPLQERKDGVDSWLEQALSLVKQKSLPETQVE